jgi:hypothetical protein
LTIRDITPEVTFDVETTADSKTVLTGHASTVVAGVDNDRKIPSIPSVADVDEEVLPEIDCGNFRNYPLFLQNFSRIIF